MHDIGIRGRFAYGTPQGGPNDQPMDLADLARVKREACRATSLTLGICSRNVGDDSNPTARHDHDRDGEEGMGRGARARPADHAACFRAAASPSCSNDAGLLGPDVQFVHPTGTTAEDRAILAAQAASAIRRRRSASRGVPASAGVIQLRRAARSRRQGLALDRSHHDLQLRPVRRHAAALFAASQSPRRARRRSPPGGWSNSRPSTARATWASPTRSAR